MTIVWATLRRASLSVKAFHGNLVSVYVKPPNTRADKIVTNEHWRRFVIDDFGPLKEGECESSPTDFKTAYTDLYTQSLERSTTLYAQILTVAEWTRLSLRAWAIMIFIQAVFPVVLILSLATNMGTYVYRPLDLQRGLFARSKISDASAGRIALADFRASGTWDIATISYSVPNYLVTKNPALRVILNNVKQTRHAIKAQRLGDEVMIRVPRAALAEHISEMPFLDIGGKRLSIVVVPPHKEYRLGDGFKYQGKTYEKDGVKVINGEISWAKGGTRSKRGIAVEPRTATSMIPDADDNIVKAGHAGAIFVRLASSHVTTLPGMKFDEMEDVATINTLPFNVDPAVRDMVFPWVRCSDREWGKGGFDWPFYNLVGYHVLYDDDSLTNFCHIQAWTLGIGETAAFHNHDTKSFCEIHACISNGTGNGGMASVSSISSPQAYQSISQWWAKDEAGDKHLGQNPNEMDNVAQYADNVIVNDMEEHGPLWRTREDGRPSLRPNDTVDYPYHAWLAGRREQPEDTGKFDVWLA
ncbi:hypothetical protein FRC07_006523 [Ceratobasidium sp. 392]|nr:hypothetical protein FRC07_006523 [Ceratobasidium sp. 392]